MRVPITDRHLPLPQVLERLDSTVPVTRSGPVSLPFPLVYSVYPVWGDLLSLSYDRFCVVVVVCGYVCTVCVTLRKIYLIRLEVLLRYSVHVINRS